MSNYSSSRFREAASSQPERRGAAGLTLAQFLDEFVEVYGCRRWSISTFTSHQALIANYIRPHLGQLPLRELNPRILDRYYQELLRLPAKAGSCQRGGKTVSSRTALEVHRLLHCACNQAVKWEYLERNPVDGASRPRHEQREREIWTAEEVCRALELCADPLLSLCIHLAFACSMRLGEILGLNWDNVYIDPQRVAANDAYLYVDRELARLDRENLERLEQRDVRLILPSCNRRAHTVLVVKTPKTHSSVRRIWLPSTVAKLLAAVREQQERNRREQAGYQDWGFVVAQANGRPVEKSRIEKSFNQLIAGHGLRPVVFHSLRHTSTTYKLKLNRGDLKSVQGDTGHAQIGMITDVYSHIIDEDRRLNAARFESAFYAPAAPAESDLNAETEQLISLLRRWPELAQTLSALLRLSGGALPPAAPPA